MYLVTAVITVSGDVGQAVVERDVRRGLTSSLFDSVKVAISELPEDLFGSRG